jgi:transcriptional regulator with XRE-family HTH domain
MVVIVPLIELSLRGLTRRHMATHLSPETQQKVRDYLRDKVLTNRSQKEVSRTSNMTQSTVSEILNGKRNVSMRIVLELSRLMDVPVEAIMGDERSAPPLCLGQLPGYLEAEKRVKLHLMSDADAEFWLTIRDTRFPVPFEAVTSTLLFRIASAAYDAWHPPAEGSKNR